MRLFDTMLAIYALGVAVSAGAAVLESWLENRSRLRFLPRAVARRR